MKFNRINSLTLSICGHIIAALLLYYGVPVNTLPASQERSIMVDMVNISDLTNIIAKHKAQKKTDVDKKTEKKSNKEIKAAEETKPEPAPEVKPVESKPVTPEVNPQVEPEAMSIPAPDKLKEVQPQKKPQKPDVKKVKPDDNQKPAKKTVKKKSDPFADASFLKTLEEVTKKSEQQNEEEKELKEALEGLETDSDVPYNADIAMSVSEKSAIRSQIEKVWNTSSFSGAKTAGLEVTLQIAFDREGNVQTVTPILKRSQSPYYQAFVDSTIRAVKMASPLQQLPPEKYNSWSVVEMKFDSSGMIQ